MNIGQLYVDQMDRSRTVRPLSPDGTCEVYFDGISHGTTKIPPRLFSLPPGTEYGFVAWVPEDELPAFESDDDDDFYDDDMYGESGYE